MLNRATNVFAEPPSGSKPWRVDGRPTVRLGALFVAMSLPLLAVGLRLVYLQGYLRDEFIAAFEQTSELFEPIPSRDGRILAANGEVLADDILHIDVAVHYRWLEQPPDEKWLRDQARQRLPRNLRRDSQRVASECEKVLARHRGLIERLARLTGQPIEKLAAERARIQARVERIAESVESRRKRTATTNDSHADSARKAWYQTVWDTVVAALTTPPAREEPDPIVVQEELQYHLLVRNVPLSVAAQIEAHPDLYPGVRIQTSTERIYPQGELAAHVVGSRLPITPEELAARAAEFPEGDPLAYTEGDRIGKTGLERSYDRQLRGIDGLRKIVTVERGSRRGEVIATEIVREPRNGRDVVVTLDLPLQRKLERLFDDTLENREIPLDLPPEDVRDSGAAGVVLDVHTGAVVAAVSAPRYDLSLLVHPDAEKWQETLNDPRQPFFHRAVRMALPPGSVFKTLSAIGLLESGQIDPDDRIVCQGYLDRPDRYRCLIFTHYGVGHGETNLSDALCHSCNVYFFQAARKTGPEPLVEWARQFGFGQLTGIDLPDEARGNLPIPDSPAKTTPREKERRRKWQTADTLQLAIGQSRLLVTPLQVARLMAAVANDGYLVTPHVVGHLGESGVASADEMSGHWPLQRIPVSSDTLSRVREGLRRVVDDPQGTAYKTVRMENVAIAGKTGTAEAGKGHGDHAWFAGYVPADRPRYAFAVVLEHGGAGGRDAGPVARKLVEALIETGLLSPRQVAAKE